MVAVLGDRQRDDLVCRIDDGLNDGRTVLRGHEEAPVDVHDVDALSLRVKGDDAVEAVLGLERGGDLAGAVGDADDAPVPGFRSHGQRGVHRRVCPVEVPEAEVNDAGALRRRGSEDRLRVHVEAIELLRHAR